MILTNLTRGNEIGANSYLLDFGADGRVVLDAGMHPRGEGIQGLPHLERLKFDSVGTILVSHAHHDHTGALPLLMRDHPGARVFMSEATYYLSEPLLHNSVQVMLKQKAEKGIAEYPLFTHRELDQLVKVWQACGLERPWSLHGYPDPDNEPLTFDFHDAGHILGSTWMELTITENGKQTLVVFSGDIGRYDQVILKDPEPPTRADFLLCESTYGDREHGTGSVPDALADVINRVAKRGGVVVIPSFAVGRTQTLMYYLRELDDAQRIPKLPVYVDSPMAISVTDIYARHHEDHDLDFTKLEQQGDRDPLNLQDVHMTRAVEDSKKINDVTSPCIIISASGMATGGRVLHHLAKRLPDSRSAVLLVGYEAEGTLGRALQDGAQFVRIHGQEVPVRAEVVMLDQLSAHAGRSELLRWLSGFTTPPRQTFLVHGEPNGLEGLRAGIASRFHWPVVVPAYLQSFDLNK